MIRAPPQGDAEGPWGEARAGIRSHSRAERSQRGRRVLVQRITVALP